MSNPSWSSPGERHHPLDGNRTNVLFFLPTGPSPTPNPRRNQNPGGSPSPAPKDSTSQPIPPSGPSRSPAQAKAAISSYQRPRLTLPPPVRRWKVHRLYPARSLKGCLPIQRFPSSDAFTPAYCMPVCRIGQPTPGLTRPSCPCFPPPSPPSVYPTDAPGRRLSSPSAVRSSAADGGIGPTQP